MGASAARVTGGSRIQLRDSKLVVVQLNEMQEVNIQTQGNMFLNVSFILLDGKTVLQSTFAFPLPITKL
jgi:hypothetical protein